jgi:UTP--glucose-1-phosphate uridylyltransferase
MIIVTGSTKRSIEDHFDRSNELENELREKGNDSKADQIKAIAEMANFVYVRQKGMPKGNARPILNAQHLIDDDEPFFVFFADDFFRSEVPRAVQMLDVYNRTGKTVMSFAEVTSETVNQYGIAEVGEELDSKAFRVKSLVEKPDAANSPSLLAQTGAYILTPDILPIIKREIPGKGGELVLGDSISELAQTDEVYGARIEGVWHDTGHPLKYLQAVVDIALEHPKYGSAFSDFLKKRLQ